MTAIWPSSLPQCPLRPFDEQPRMAKNSFESDTGPAIEGPKGTVRLSEVSMSFRMTKEQVSTLEEFVFTDLGQGARDFMFTHPRKHTQVRMRMLGGDRPYQISWHAAGKYIVSFQALVIG